MKTRQIISSAFLLLFLQGSLAQAPSNTAQVRTVKYGLSLTGVSKSKDYLYPNMEYTYELKTDWIPNGSFPANFKVTIENGKYTDPSYTGKTIMDVFPNSRTIKVIWNNELAWATIKVSHAKPNDPKELKLVASKDSILKYKIATLKGITPSTYIKGGNGSVPAFGNKGVIETEGTIMEYPEGINDTLTGHRIQRKRVGAYQWKLPKGWKISGVNPNNDGTFTTIGERPNAKITTDYFS